MDDKTIEQQIMEEIRGLTAPLTKKIEEIRADLDKMRQEGIHPANDKVQKLEDQLRDLREEVRTIQTQTLATGQQEKRSEADTDIVLLARAHNLGYIRLPEEITKRAIDTSVLASGGKLNPEQANAFIDYFVDQADILRRVQLRRMRGTEAYIETIGVANRKLRAKGEGTAAPTADSVSTGRRMLTTKVVQWNEDITDELMEESIAGRGTLNHITRLLAGAFANDVADLAWNGDEALAATITDSNSDGLDDTTGLSQNDHTFLRLNDGWLKIIEASNAPTYDASSATAASKVFRNLIEAMPPKYRRMGHIIWAPHETAMAYADELATRGTALGDRALTQGADGIPYMGYTVYPDPYLTKNGALPRRAVLTPAQNLAYGVTTEVEFDIERKPRPGIYEVTIRARFDFEIASDLVAAIATNIPDL